MKARLARYMAVGVISFLIGALYLLPAQVAADWIESRIPLRLSGVTGTLIAGHANYVRGSTWSLDNLSWTLHPLDLLLGHLTADFHVDSDLDGFNGTLTRSLFGGTRIDNLSGDASATWLARLGGFTFLPLSGRLGVDISHAVFNNQLQVSALKGHLQLSHTRWQLVNPPVDLGRFRTNLQHTNNGIRVAITDSQGPLAVDGDITLGPSRHYDLDVRLRARTGADKRLGQLLAQLGPGNAEGWHPVRETGQM